MAAALALSACSSLPGDAPSSMAIFKDATFVARSEPQVKHVDYALVPLRSGIMSAVNRWSGSVAPHFSNLPKDGRYAAGNGRIGAGDVISVTIYEAAAGGLFIPIEATSRQGNYVQIPNQQVDSQGYITVPFAGSLHVANLTAREAGGIIAKRLAKRAIEPQVVVSINEKKGGSVSVLGDVTQSTRFTLDASGTRLLDAIARAGGPKYAAHETTVALQRGGHVYRGSMTEIMDDPSENVSIGPSDVVYLTHEPRFVLFFGATSDNNSNNTHRVTFENDRMSLGEALAKAGGLAGGRADAKSVFVFRTEKVDNLRRIGVDVAAYSAPTVPTVYAVNFSTAEGVFMATNFNLRDHDVVVAADANSVNFLKFINVLNQAAATPLQAGGVWAAWITAKK